MNVPYPPLLHLATEEEYRSQFEQMYCLAPIQTFDGIDVRFCKKDFDHCCFESSRRNTIKDQFSRRRAARLHWIKATLEDANAELYVGWDKRRKRYDRKRRVAIVAGSYVVVIALKGHRQADFLTAFVADTAASPGRASTVDKIRMAPVWAQKNR